MLSQAIDASFQVYVVATSGSAIREPSGQDVSVSQLTIQFNPKQVERTALFRVIEDTEVELAEQFYLDIFNVVSDEYEIIVADSRATVTIIDNDEPPRHLFNSEIEAVGIRHPDDFFGRSFSVDGDILVVGAPQWDQTLQNQGAAFIYARNIHGTPGNFSDDTW